MKKELPTSILQMGSPSKYSENRYNKSKENVWLKRMKYHVDNKRRDNSLKVAQEESRAELPKIPLPEQVSKLLRERNLDYSSQRKY